MPEETGKLSPFDCVSPFDFRYYATDPRLVELLGPYVTERGRLRAEARVEAAAARVLARHGICPPEAAEEIARAAEEVTAEEIATEDARIHHETRALVNSLQRRVSAAARPFVHLTLTSFDVKDTAAAWRFRQAATGVIVPELNELIRVLIGLARREQDTLQIGRTHGQHGVPITFGLAIACYVSRLGGRSEAIRQATEGLCGKISGAVGAYNASSLLLDDPLAFEREVLAELGLEPSPSSTQIVEAEPLTDYLHALISTLGVLANVGDDLRHLQRTEIAEVGEAFEAEQVGSSTMPHKRNPWNCENVKSMWKAMMPRMVSVYADQISEHQRDLTNSASARFLPEVIVALVSTVQRLRRIMGRLVTDREQMRRNLEMTRGLFAAEPAYILLASVGHPDAHEAVRQVTLRAEAEGLPFAEALEQADELRPYLDRLPAAQRELLADPSRYVGQSSRKTELLCAMWEQRLGLG